MYQNSLFVRIATAGPILAVFVHKTEYEASRGFSATADLVSFSTTANRRTGVTRNEMLHIQ